MPSPTTWSRYVQCSNITFQMARTLGYFFVSKQDGSNLSQSLPSLSTTFFDINLRVWLNRSTSSLWVVRTSLYSLHPQQFVKFHLEFQCEVTALICQNTLTNANPSKQFYQLFGNVLSVYAPNWYDFWIACGVVTYHQHIAISTVASR